MSVFRKVSCLILMSVCCAGILSAQDLVRGQLFGNADQAMSQAKEKRGDFYAERTFMKALEYYRDADEKYKGGGNLDDIRDKLKTATDLFTKAADVGKQAAIMFSRVITARTNADSASASNYSPELWRKAEDAFKQAAQKFEDGSVEDARGSAAEAEAAYHTAELEALKTNFLAPARTLLQRADETNAGDNAPKTLARARMLSAKVDSILKQNIFDTDEARQVAEEAKYEAAHALYLYQLIQTMKQQDKTFEDAILTDERHLDEVADFLGIKPHFDQGFEGPVRNLITAIKSKDAGVRRDEDSIKQLSDISRQKDNEIDNLRQQIGSMEKRVGSLTENEKELQKQGEDLQQKLLLKEQQDETIRNVRGMFTEQEGIVLRDGDNIILRLYGLSFPVGKSEVEPEYYPLLTRVQDAIKKFPNCKVAIEGHTDSQGSDEMNQTLSENRAKSVAEYLMANMNVSIPINSQGYGESRPVASNDTPEGRAKNRRIDVVITPEWAQSGK